MKQITILILATLLLLDLRLAKSETPQSSMTQKQTDTSVIAILPFIDSGIGVFKKGKSAQLTPIDLSEIEKLLTDCINKYNMEQEKKFNAISKEHPNTFDENNFVIDLKHYKRQYIAFINEKGEKEVFINCFCRDWGKNWKKEIIMVKDGGNCYFNLKINLTTKTQYDLQVNGEA